MSVTFVLRNFIQFYRKIDLHSKKTATKNLLFLGIAIAWAVWGIIPTQIFAQNAQNRQNNQFISMKQMRQTLFSDKNSSPLASFRDKLVGQNPQTGMQNRNQNQNMRPQQEYSAPQNMQKSSQNSKLFSNNGNGTRLFNAFRQPQSKQYSQPQNAQNIPQQSYPQNSKTLSQNSGRPSQNPYAKQNTAAYRNNLQTASVPQTATPSAPNALTYEKQMEYLTKGSTSREDAAEAARQIPWNLLSPQAQQISESLVKNHSFYRRLPLAGGYCNPEAYDFLLCHPEMVVGIWEGLGHNQLSLRPTGPEQYTLQESGGSSVNIQVLYHDNNKILFYGNGVYQGSLFTTSLQGEALVVMQYRFTEDTNNDHAPIIVTRLDTFIRLNNAGADMISRFFAPAIGKVIDSNFVKTVNSVNEISKAMEVNPEGLNQVVRSAVGVDSQTKNEMIAITDRVCSQAYLRARGEQVDYYLLPKMNMPQIATAQILSRRNQTIKIINPNQLSQNQTDAYASASPQNGKFSAPLSGFTASEGGENSLLTEETLYFFSSDQNEGDFSTSNLRPGNVLPDDEMEAFTLTNSASSSMTEDDEFFSLDETESAPYASTAQKTVKGEEKEMRSSSESEDSDIFFPENPSEMLRYYSNPQETKNSQAATQSTAKASSTPTVSVIKPKKTALKTEDSPAISPKKSAALPLTASVQSTVQKTQKPTSSVIPTQSPQQTDQNLHLDTFFESDDSEMSLPVNEDTEIQEQETKDLAAAKDLKEKIEAKENVIEMASIAPQITENRVTENQTSAASEFNWESAPSEETIESESESAIFFESDNSLTETKTESAVENDSAPQNLWKKPSFIN